MAKRILITSTDSMMRQFLEPHVWHLLDNGYEVEIACSEVLSRFSEIVETLGKRISIHRVSLSRNPLSFKNIKGYFQLRSIIEAGNFDLIWTNEPVMGVVTRLAARKARKLGTKVLYMVHGFHFFRGAPLPNWIAFYPIERFMKHLTDCICTINREDYAVAEEMGFPLVKYIHGIGIDVSRLKVDSEKSDVRKELGLDSSAFLVVSVGELNRNKNHATIIKALAHCTDKDIHYLVCGKGFLRKNLESLAQKLQVAENVHFLGYRKDVMDICRQANLFAFPSRREGLSIASLEAMYCGLPVITSRIRGQVDVVEDGVSGFLYAPNDSDGFFESIQWVKNHPEFAQKTKKQNPELVKPFLLSNTKKEVLEIVQSLIS